MSILRAYDPPECDGRGVPLDWERCRACEAARNLANFAAAEAMCDLADVHRRACATCATCGGYGSLKAAVLASRLARFRGSVPIPEAEIGHRCENCGHPLSEGTWEDPPLAEWLGTFEARERGRKCILRGVEPKATAGGSQHYSPCDEGCRHSGPLRCDSPSDLTTRWDTYLPVADTDVLRSVVGAGVKVEASWRPVDVRCLGWPHDLRPERLAVLCLRCFAARTTPSGAHDRATGRTTAPEGPGSPAAGADGDDPAHCPARGVQPTTSTGEGRAANGERHAPSPVEHRPYGGPRP